MPTFRPQQPLDRMAAWASGFSSLHQWFELMSSPPTIAPGNNGSTINGSYFNGNCPIKGDSPLLSIAGSDGYVATSAGGSAMYMAGKHISGTAASSYAKAAGSAPLRYKFVTDAPKFEFCIGDQQVGGIMILVDGKLISVEQIQTTTGSFVSKYVLVDFGTNVQTWGTAQTTLTPNTGGTGHAIGDVITFNGGAGGAAGTPIQAKVTNATGGVVAGLTTTVTGAYTTLPTSPFTQASTTGSGTGLTIPAFLRRNQTTKKFRTIEIIVGGTVAFLGIVVDTASVVLPGLRNTRVPKVVFVGDSITAGTYLQGAHISSRVARALGVWDRFSVSAVGGTGWSKDGQGIMWSDSHRIDDLVAQNADLYVFHGSQNDTGTANATLTGLVRDTIDAIMTRVPNCYVVGTGPVVSVQSLSDVIKAGFLAAKFQNRIRYIDNYIYPWLISNQPWIVVSDSSHLSQDGQDYYAGILSTVIADSLLSMIPLG